MKFFNALKVLTVTGLLSTGILSGCIVAPGARLLRRCCCHGGPARATRRSGRCGTLARLRLVSRLLELEWRRACVGWRALGRRKTRLSLGATRLGALRRRLAHGVRALGTWVENCGVRLGNLHFDLSRNLAHFRQELVDGRA